MSIFAVCSLSQKYCRRHLHVVHVATVYFSGADESKFFPETVEVFAALFVFDDDAAIQGICSQFLAGVLVAPLSTHIALPSPKRQNLGIK